MCIATAAIDGRYHRRLRHIVQMGDEGDQRGFGWIVAAFMERGSG